jgi:hypothetical protein
MTLCIAWKNVDIVYFASDSRLTSGSSVQTDEANKIFKIGVEVYGPTSQNSHSQEPPLLYRTNYGMCFAGSYLNGSILADTVSEVLSNLQIVPGYSDISIDNISSIALGVYRQVSTHLMNRHRENGLSSVLFGGYCLDTNVFKLYHFTSFVSSTTSMVDFKKEEVELMDNPFLVGDTEAKRRYTEIMEKNISGYTNFHVLRDVIKDDSVSTVGGKIQCGYFKGNTFRTNGIVEYRIDNNGDHPMVQADFNFRGLSLNLDANDLRSGDVNIMKTLFDPFEAEGRKLFEIVQQAIESRMNQSHAGE